MPKLLYIARDSQGRKITGSEEAVDPDQLISRLQAKNLVVVNIIPEQKDDVAKSAKSSGAHIRMHFGVVERDLVMFCRQLATLLGAGVTILKSLEVILKQVASRKLYDVIKRMIRDMESGLSLHEAMAKHPKVFSDLWVNLIESGEASGNLAVVLNRLAGYLERNAEFKKSIISALIYPVILMTAGFGALFFLTVKIIPTFAQIFEGFNVALPPLTQALVATSAFVRKFILLILGLGVAGGYLFMSYIKTNQGRKVFEGVLFKLPLFGDFFRALVVERFSSELSTLVESGVPILYSLEIIEHSIDNLVMADIVHEIKDNVRQGKPLSQQLEKSGFFEPIVVQMVSVGEEIGELAQMFKRINAFYEEAVKTFLQRFTTLFEPLMLLFMGFIIGTMVVGLFLPIFKLTQMRG